MIDLLPLEIVLQILSHLPTLTDLLNLNIVNRKLHEIFKNHQTTIFHTFADIRFPSIKAGPPWEYAVSRLTSRSRAWDRRALIARECAPPREENQTLPRNGRFHQFGYVPVIDSYETLPSDATTDKEVLAWGAAGRLRLRTTHNRRVSWSSFKTPEDARAHTDILSLHLLRPHQNRNKYGESILIRRANREIALLNAMPEADSFVVASSYVTKRDIAIDCVTVSNASEPLIAVCESKSLQLLPLHSAEQENHAERVIPLAETSTIKQRKRCALFVDNTRLAMATQHLEGTDRAPVLIYDVTPSGLASTPLIQVDELVTASSTLQGRKCANVLANVDSTSHGQSTSGNLILSGWSDGIARLFDLRSGSEPVRNFADAVDDGQIFSILPIGRERFLAGSHQNACLKTFDMRMNARVYDYRCLYQPRRPSERRASSDFKKAAVARDSRSRDINVFLALTVHRAAQPWQPLPGRHNTARLPRYRGSVYSLSAPSPSSPTVYAGIENHVIQLDFVNTDDCILERGRAHQILDKRPILDVSCYERPRSGYESTDTVLLRKQADWQHCWHSRNDAEEGWDERWRLERQRTVRGMAANWQR